MSAPASPSKCRASPKSATLGVPSAVSRMLPGFRSRCTIPAWCATCTASASVIRSAAAWRAGCGVPESGLRQAAPFEELHREKRAALMVAHIVDLHDVRVAQARHHLRFALEPRPLVRSCVRPGLQHLEGDDAVQAQMPRLVDDRPSRRARASPGRRSRESRGTFRPAARQAPAADPVVGNHESTWASSSRRRLKRSRTSGSNSGQA